MPRVKIDYIVSFSDEDPENKASNLLSWEVSRKRWLCRAGEPSCSAVLQLARAVQISSLQIGVYHAALVEVLVGRSETPNEPYQVLVPRSVFVSPREARGAALERVRSFAGAALAPCAARRWDRLRLVASQPYNKHCQYGISFIHVFEEGDVASAAPAPAPAVPPRLLELETFSSDEEEFTPGELFAKHRQSGGDTGAQIRQATAKALNSSEATKLVMTSLSKHRPSPSRAPAPRPRDKPDLLYTEDDDQPHAKIDHIVQRHRDEKGKEESKTPKPKEKVKEKDNTPRRDEPTGSKHDRKDRVEPKPEQSERQDADRRQANGGSSKKDESRKRTHEKDRDNNEEDEPGPVCAAPLSGVVFVLSGYQHPRRARLRELAGALGAAPRAAWGPGCTHLICAFSSTPKLSEVRAARGARVPAPRGEWLEACARAGRRLPWRWFACEPSLKLEPPAQLPTRDESDGDADTDDEIEEVLRRNKRARAGPSPPGPRAPRTPPARPARGRSGDVEFEKDDRMQGSVTLSDCESSDTDVEAGADAARGAGRGGSLGAALAGLRVSVRRAAPADAALLARYVRALGGLVLQPEEAEDDDCIVLCGTKCGGEGAARGERLRADWLWACHAAAARLPAAPYRL